MFHFKVLLIFSISISFSLKLNQKLINIVWYGYKKICLVKTFFDLDVHRRLSCLWFLMSRAKKGLKALNLVSKRLSYVKISLFHNSLLNSMAWKEQYVLTLSSLQQLYHTYPLYVFLTIDNDNFHSSSVFGLFTVANSRSTACARCIFVLLQA